MLVATTLCSNDDISDALVGAINEDIAR